MGLSSIMSLMVEPSAITQLEADLATRVIAMGGAPRHIVSLAPYPLVVGGGLAVSLGLHDQDIVLPDALAGDFISFAAIGSTTKIGSAAAVARAGKPVGFAFFDTYCVSAGSAGLTFMAPAVLVGTVHTITLAALAFR